jgi:hypothetical protein
MSAYLIEVAYPVVAGVIQEGLVLAHVFDDFEPDGFSILKESGVQSVVQNAHCALWDTMLRGENLLGALDRPPQLDWTSLAAVIRSIAAQYQFLVIKCESIDEPVQDFYLGRLLDIRDDAVYFRTLSAMARWEDEQHRIPLSDITRIEFDTAYLRRFTKYIEA